MPMLAWVGSWGRSTLAFVGASGRATVFLKDAATRALRPPLRPALLFQHVHFIGVRSLGVVLLTAAFTGMVLTLQGYNALVRFGSEAYLGPLVALSLVRELGPVLGALMVSARAGSAIAATVGQMRVTEQIDAMDVMAVDSIQFLASTRLWAAIIAGPILVLVFDAFGIKVAQVFGAAALGVDPAGFMATVKDALTFRDISISLYKAFAFSVITVWIACFMGYRAGHGAEGVGRATTHTVVLSAVLILFADYVMTALLLS